MTKVANFRRGFFRLWLVASAAWVLGILLLLPLKWQADYTNRGWDAMIAQRCATDDKECERSRYELYRLYLEEGNLENIYSQWWVLLVPGAFVPPIAVYVVLRVLVGIIAWVFMGFATSPPLPRERFGLRRVAGIIGKEFVSLWPRRSSRL